MKKLTILIPALTILCGCAYMRSTTLRETDPKTGIVKEKTTARAYALFDSNASLTKFHNRSGYGTNSDGTVHVPGTSADGVNAQASGTNAVEALKQLNQMTTTVLQHVP